MANVIGLFSTRTGLFLGCLWIITFATASGLCPGNQVVRWLQLPGAELVHNGLDAIIQPDTTTGVPLAECQAMCFNRGSACVSVEYSATDMKCQTQAYNRKTPDVLEEESPTVDLYEMYCDDPTTTASSTTTTTTTTTTNTPELTVAPTDTTTDTPTTATTSPTTTTTTTSSITTPVPQPTTATTAATEKTVATTTTTTKPPQRRMGVRFSFEADYNETIEGEGKADELKVALTNKVAAVAGISPARVQDMAFKPGSVISEFVIMPGPDTEPTVAEAIERLRNSVSGDEFVLDAANGSTMAANTTSFETFEVDDGGDDGKDGTDEEEEEDESVLYRLRNLGMEYYVLIGMAVVVVLLVITAVVIICTVSGKK